MVRKTKRYAAATLAAALTLGVSGGTFLATSATAAGADRIAAGNPAAAEDYLESNYLSLKFTAYTNSMGLSNLSMHDRTMRVVRVEPIGGENENYE